MIPIFPVNFPQGQEQVMDRMGRLTQVGRFLLLQVWNRTGAGTGVAYTVLDGMASGDEASADFCFYTGGGAGGSIVLYSGMIPGVWQAIWNLSADPVEVMPFGGALIDTMGSYTLAAGSMQVFVCRSLSDVRTFGSLQATLDAVAMGAVVGTGDDAQINSNFQTLADAINRLGGHP